MASVLAAGLLFTGMAQANFFLDALKQSMQPGAQQGTGQQQGAQKPFNLFAPKQETKQNSIGATVVKGANVRSGPGTSNEKVGYLPNHTTLAHNSHNPEVQWELNKDSRSSFDSLFQRTQKICERAMKY